MNNDINNTEHQNGPNRGKVLAGIALLLIGAVLFLNQFDSFPFLNWVISLPMGLIVLGLYMGGKNNFRNSTWLIMVLIGAYFLLHRIIPAFDPWAFFWPVALITVGIFFILRRNNHKQDYWNKKDYWDKKDWKRKWEASKYGFANPNPNPAEPVVDYTVGATPNDPSTPPNPAGFTGDEHLEAISIFGGVKKVIFSKNFQGGEIVNICGGSELDFTQADINGRIYIDVTQVFGGTKIIVPAHWMIVSDMASIFAGFDDKRIRTSAPLDNNKVLVLKGVSIFAGIDIRSY